MPTSRVRPKRWEVIKRTMRPEKGIKVGGKFYKYGTSGSFTVEDPGVARAMQKDHAADVLVAEVDRPKRDVSNNTFAALPEMPWHKGKRKPWWERRQEIEEVDNEKTKKGQVRDSKRGAQTKTRSDAPARKG